MVRDTGKGSLYLKIVMPKEQGLKYSLILNKNRRHSRSSVRVKEGKTSLVVEISARDATSLRASANSILRDLQVIEATKQ